MTNSGRPDTDELRKGANFLRHSIALIIREVGLPDEPVMKCADEAEAAAAELDALRARRPAFRWEKKDFEYLRQLWRRRLLGLPS